ncbi:hypothetical protein D3C83_66500 [compost metagenome]
MAEFLIFDTRRVPSSARLRISFSPGLILNNDGRLMSLAAPRAHCSPFEHAFASVTVQIIGSSAAMTGALAAKTALARVE